MTEKEIEQNVKITGANAYLLNMYLLGLADAFFSFLEKEYGQIKSDEVQRDFYFHLSTQLHFLTLGPWNSLDDNPVLKQAVEERVKEVDRILDEINERLLESE